MTQQFEQELQYNLERHEEWSKSFPNIKLQPYRGPFKHLDLEQTWFCPRCRNLNKPLVLSTNKLTLFCTAPAHTCEYSYSNFEERTRRKSYLGEGYSLPLSLGDVTQITIGKLQKEHEDNIRKKEDLDLRNEEIHNHIIKLQRTLQ